MSRPARPARARPTPNATSWVGPGAATPRPARVHDDVRRGHRIHPRTGGHLKLHDDGGKSYYYLTDATGNVLGRFTQPDPSEQEANPYLYAGGAPVNNTGKVREGHDTRRQE
ncbi:hypothetical protein GCM10010423_24680 [Streptomyces levis]|uniref:Uncharacterized protein n=1 Tax=Streptomyces levis TaxID=285566 RepID=A0ABN3NNW0_9ACTN